MALQPRQVSVRGLTMGRGTPYMITGDINPFTLNVRADQTGDNPWGHGGWSGAEWRDKTAIPFQIHVEAPSGDAAGAMPLLHAFRQAFRPVGDTAQDIEYRAHMGDREYLVYVRPASLEPDLTMLYQGQFTVSAAVVANDPIVYSGELNTTDPIKLPRFTGGLSVPFLVPFMVEQVRVGGAVQITNEGISDTGLLLRIDGPVDSPRVALQRPDGIVQTLRWANGLTLPENRWVDVDTAAETAYLDGLVGASVYPGFIEWPSLPTGTSTLLFDAADRDAAGLLTASWRHAW